jgi:membrane-bound lytic murein transglycosylase D
MHRVKLDDLILANNLDRRATVYARQTLRIPQRGQLVQTAKKAQRPRPAVSALRVAAVDSAAPMFVVPKGLPVEGPVTRYRRPEPAPADLLAMADTEPENAG